VTVPQSHADFQKGESHGIRIAPEMLPNLGQRLTGGILQSRSFDLSGGRGRLRRGTRCRLSSNDIVPRWIRNSLANWLKVEPSRYRFGKPTDGHPHPDVPGSASPVLLACLSFRTPLWVGSPSGPAMEPQERRRSSGAGPRSLRSANGVGGVKRTNRADCCRWFKHALGLHEVGRWRYQTGAAFGFLLSRGAQPARSVRLERIR